MKIPHEGDVNSKASNEESEEKAVA
jgi:hypothetical protein